MVDAIRYAELASKINSIHQKKTSSYLNFKKPFIYATLNGAKALKIDDKTGSLEVGKEFDAVIADVSASLESVFLENDSPGEILNDFCQKIMDF
jgi:guanine deaminase